MKTFVQSFLGTLAALAVLLGSTLAVVSCSTGKTPKVPRGAHLVIRLHDSMPEYDPPGDLMSQLTGGSPETLQRVLDNLKKAAVDDRIDGVVFHVTTGASIGAAKAEEIRHAIARVQEAGKPVVGFAESFGLSQYRVLAACDPIYMPPTAYVNFHGVQLETMHAKQALEKLGIRPNMHRIKDYKSAAELILREDMSETSRENKEWMLDDGWKQTMELMSEHRGRNESQVLAAMEHALFNADEAVQHGLVDELIYWDELENRLQGDDDPWKTISQAEYAQIPMRKLGFKGKRRIAVVHAQGTIMGRTSGVNPLLGLTMGHETIVAQLRAAREDDDVAAIILRVDSPGGDALASDLMGHEVEVAAAVKPVVVSMVDVAASGGYHISYRASRIIADGMTVTGSIGSISGKFNTAPMYEKLGVTFDSIERGPQADMNSDHHDWTPEQRARYEDNHWDGFNDWLRDVSEHRGMTFEEAESLAHGRVWTGWQARDNGLVDEVGDLEHAIAVAKRLADVPEEDEVTVVHLPETKSLVESMLGGGNSAALAARWLVYRSVRSEVRDTLTILESNPELVLDPVAMP